MGFVSCLEDQQKRFESDCHILHRDIQSGRADGESAKKDALRLLSDAQVCSGQLIPDSILSFSSATTGGMPSLNV